MNKTCSQCYWFQPSNKCFKGKRLQTFGCLSAENCDEFYQIKFNYTYQTSSTFDPSKLNK